MWQLPALRPSDENVVFRFSYPLAMFFRLFLRFSDEDARNEHECSAKSYLQGGGEHWRFHEPVSHPCDDSEFY
jgi:hypothetical protein